MKTTETAKASETPLSQDLLNLLRYWLSGRRGLMIMAALVIGTAAIFNWSWLVAIGLAPLILSILPCAMMCALGLCMNKMGGKSCSSKGTASQSATPSRVTGPGTSGLSDVQMRDGVGASDLAGPAVSVPAPLEADNQSSTSKETRHA